MRLVPSRRLTGRKPLLIFVSRSQALHIFHSLSPV